MSGEWGMADIKARIAQLEAEREATAIAEGDGLTIVGDEIRLDIASLPTAPEN